MNPDSLSAMATPDDNVTCDVAALSELRDGGLTIVRVGVLEIGIARWGRELYAIRNVCPHALGPICKGPVIPRLRSSAVGDYQTDPDAPVLVCPWHRWEFDLATGAALADARMRLRRFPVRVESGRVLIDVPARLGGDRK
jgi:nitrite reductase (NADH) small subunit